MFVTQIGSVDEACMDSHFRSLKEIEPKGCLAIGASEEGMNKD